MTREAFCVVMNYIRLAIGKDKIDRDMLDVYFDCLGDLDAAAFQLAARRVILEHRFPTWPSIAELRQAAVESSRGEVKEMSPAEAWDVAWTAVCRIDLEVAGSAERALKQVPPLVVEALRAFGLPSLCVSGGRDFDGDERRTDPVSVQRGQFIEIYKQLATRDRRAALLPPATHAELRDIRERRERAAPVRQAIEGIGRAVPA